MAKAIIVCGSPGAGKSSYAKALCRSSGAAILDIDTVTERLVRLSLAQVGKDSDDRDSDFFKATYREPIYEVLFDIASENLAHTNVVIVGPFTKEIRDEAWPAKLTVRLGVPVEVHYLFCNAETRRKRLINRANPRDANKLADWNVYLSAIGDEKPPKFKHIFVDTTNFN